MSNYLLEGDLEPNSILVESIDKYFSECPAGSEPRRVLKAFSQIKPAGERAFWFEKVEYWKEELAELKDPNKASN